MNHNRSEKFWNGRVVGSVVRGLAVAFVAFAISGIASAQTDWFNTLQFEGGIGVTPVTGVAANGAVNLNIVRGVSPAGPWRIAALEATVRPDGHIRSSAAACFSRRATASGPTAVSAFMPPSSVEMPRPLPPTTQLSPEWPSRLTAISESTISLRQPRRSPALLRCC